MSVVELPTPGLTGCWPPIGSAKSSSRTCHVGTHGKFFQLDGGKWTLKGLTYGPFRGDGGRFLLSDDHCRADFAQIRDLGANCIRLYHVPDRDVLDLAQEFDLRVMVDVPWQKHRCFFEDLATTREARKRIADAARKLSGHPALFGISVVNEVPPDIVRFYGRRMVGGFIDELIDSVKQAAPTCLTTFTNYPSTEFLTVERSDFLCFNVYLESNQSLRAYLDRLQHLAGNRPVILGEFGFDSIRNGEDRQAAMLEGHLHSIHQHGLAGSILFSFTDEWFTGGREIQDWAFGLVRRDRTPKLAAECVRSAWAESSRFSPYPQPRVSVVVCSYNGGSTLRACLQSLEQLDYPDYEVILVDDGSTDDTGRIAADFPRVRTIRQENLGLSVARNVGAEAATGEIVAYTDSDCTADPHWLSYLVDTMQRQDVAVVGGPNIPPPVDSWTAHCVAASPGGPSHVMIDDQRAEHVPGCNMAFRRNLLLELGGFDPRFRQAGDDVDICWRFLSAGHHIGFAPGAVVWHYRRNTARAFLKQQKGYGRAEAMLYYKHPARFNALGSSRWNGIIYGEGSVGLAVREPLVHHGVYGMGLFQCVYTRNSYSVRGYPTLLEWHAAAMLGVLFAGAHHAFGVLAVLMWLATVGVVTRSVLTAKLPPRAPWWCRPLLFALHLLQPIVRSAHRYHYRFTARKMPRSLQDEPAAEHLTPKGWFRRDAHWHSPSGAGREALLDAIAAEARALEWPGVFDNEWAATDVYLTGDRWLNVEIQTATEELGDDGRFTRAKVYLTPSRLFKTALGLGGGLLLIATATRSWSLAVLAATLLAALAIRGLISRRNCFRGAAGLLGIAAKKARLNSTVRPVVQTQQPEPVPADATLDVA